MAASLGARGEEEAGGGVVVLRPGRGVSPPQSRGLQGLRGGRCGASLSI